MAVSHSGTYVQLPKCGLAQILPADTTNRKALITASADGNKVVAISAINTDTVNDRLLQFWVSRGGIFYLLNTVNVPVTAGNVGTVAPVNIFANWTGLPVDNDGQKYLYLESGDVFSVASTGTVATLKEVDVIAVYGNF